MRKLLMTAALVFLVSVGSGCGGPTTQGEQQTLVDRSALATQEMMTQTISNGPRDFLHRAKAVMICPRIFKAGFFFGGEGGRCVLLARAGNGTWSYPAFYNIGSGSFGLQIGIQDSQLLMLIMTDKGLNAILDSQFKIGGSASIAVATLGAGIQGSTTAAVGADILAFSAARGLYGGISLEGSLMTSLTDWNRSYYGQPFAARQIVIEMQGSNPGADPLRDLLTRFGTPQAAVPPPAPAQPSQVPPGYQPAAPASANPTYLTPPAATGRGPVQEQSLPAAR
ncbi:lipid-binding SYLF domain-containing protein [Rhodopila sp.]|jgi:lipid-binding SYLF domain-containing protein|uniref:lipid-binding SYLF domain-containing protein n=1 Tax=Rhodopila sp. TaxID=2480087 RepID=UPI002CF3120B|nr:YSC84-related protein [Rhodopila sp.]HVZ07725.1 YSC84-related protein [Rhodopila sp.]